MNLVGVGVAERVFPVTVPINILAQATTRVIPAYKKKRALVLSLNATGGNAADTVDFYAASEAGQTTIAVAAAAAGTTVALNGDAGVNDVLNGHTILADNDWVMLNLDARDRILSDWQISLIDTLGGATAGQIDITDAFNITGPENQFDDATGFRAAASVGNVAYIIDAEEKATVLVGAGSVNVENVFVGNPGHPCIITSHGDAAAAHYLTAVVGYID